MKKNAISLLERWAFYIGGIKEFEFHEYIRISNPAIF